MTILAIFLVIFVYVSFLWLQAILAFIQRIIRIIEKLIIPIIIILIIGLFIAPTLTSELLNSVFQWIKQIASEG